MIVDFKVRNSDRPAGDPKITRNQDCATDSRMDADWVKTVNVPLVIFTYHETGRKSLYCVRLCSIKYKGSTDDASPPRLDFLMDWGTRPLFAYWFRWRNGSVALRDNFCSKHIAVDDSHQERCKMRRVWIAGDQPF